MSGHRQHQSHHGHHEHHEQADGGMTYTGIFYRREEDPSGNGAPGPPPVGAVMVEEIQSPSMQSGQPMAMVCPHCRKHMETEVIYETGMGAWLVAGLICLSGCCCFAWIPLVANVMKDAIHNCSECHREVGRYIRLQPHQPQQRRRRKNTKRRPAREQQESQKSTSSWRSGSRSSEQQRRDSKNSSGGGGFFNFGGGGDNKSNNRKESNSSGGLFSWGDKGRSQSERRGDGKRDLTDRERKQRQQGGGQQRGSFSLW